MRLQRARSPQSRCGVFSPAGSVPWAIQGAFHREGSGVSNATVSRTTPARSRSEEKTSHATTQLTMRAARIRKVLSGDCFRLFHRVLELRKSAFAAADEQLRARGIGCQQRLVPEDHARFIEWPRPVIAHRVADDGDPRENQDWGAPSSEELQRPFQSVTRSAPSCLEPWGNLRPRVYPEESSTVLPQPWSSGQENEARTR